MENLIQEKLRELVYQLHKEYGWFNEEELSETPRRVAKFYFDWHTKSSKNFNFTTFPVKGKASLITFKNLEFASVCGHHILPFTGKISIAYLPWDEKEHGVYAGISKFARTVEKFSRKPQTQEIMTEEITNFLWDNLGDQTTADPKFHHPRFLFVQVSEATHTCTTIRGAEQHRPLMGTNGMRWNETMSQQEVESLRQEAMMELREGRYD